MMISNRVEGIARLNDMFGYGTMPFHRISVRGHVTQGEDTV